MIYSGSHTIGNKTRHKPSDSKNVISFANPYNLILEPVQMYSSHTNMMKEELFLVTIDEKGKIRMTSPCNSESPHRPCVASSACYFSSSLSCLGDLEILCLAFTLILRAWGLLWRDKHALCLHGLAPSASHLQSSSLLMFFRLLWLPFCLRTFALVASVWDTVSWLFMLAWFLLIC